MVAEMLSLQMKGFMFTQKPLLEKSNFANEIFPYLLGSLSLPRRFFTSSPDLQ